MNVELLEKVKAHILANPRRLDMANWGRRVYGPDAPACGTTGCIAGWAAFLSNPALLQAPIGEFESYCNTFDSQARLDGQIQLGLADDEAESLFFVENWPDEFRLEHDEAEEAEDKQRMADTTAARIEHFIRTKGKE